MTIVKNALTALDDLKNIFDLTIIDFNYYEELRMLGVNEKNAKIRATIRGLLKQELNIDNNPSKDTYETFEIFSDLVFDEICLIKDNQHSASFRTHVFYTRLLQNTTFGNELYENFGCLFMLETSDINNISDVQIKYEFERRFGKPEEIDLNLDDEDYLDLDLDDDDELDLDSDDDLDLGSEDDLDLDSDDDLDLDGDDEDDELGEYFESEDLTEYFKAVSEMNEYFNNDDGSDEFIGLKIGILKKSYELVILSFSDTMQKEFDRYKNNINNPKHTEFYIRKKISRISYVLLKNPVIAKFVKNTKHYIITRTACKDFSQDLNVNDKVIDLSSHKDLDFNLDIDDEDLVKENTHNQKKSEEASYLVDDRPFCDVALLDYDYCISCLKVVEEHHKNGQMVNIPMCFFPLYDFELDTTTDYKEATLQKMLERLQNVRLIERELIDGEWHYALTEQGESELIDNRATLKSEVQTNQGQGTITLKKYKGKKTFSQFSFEKGDVCVRWYGENFYFSSYEEIHRVIGVLDNAIPNKWFDAVVDEYCIYDTISLSNALKSFYIDSLYVEQKFIDFIKSELKDNSEVKIPLATFANALTFGSIDKTNKVLRRLLKKKMIKRRQKIEGSAYTYSLGKGDKLDFNIDF